MAGRAALFLLPGLMCDAEFWRAQAAMLSGMCETHIPSYGLADDIGAMADLVIAQAPPRFALAGHSMGGRVAQEVCRRVPDRVERLGLFATDFRASVDAAAKADEARQRADLLAAVVANGVEVWARLWAKDMVAAGRQDDEALLGAITAMVLRQAPGQLAAQTLAGLNRPDFATLLPAIRCPTLICAGDEDSLRSIDTHREMAALIPNSRLAVLENCGHMTAMEEPGVVTALMRDWLTA